MVTPAQQNTMVGVLELQDSNHRYGIWDGEVVDDRDPSRVGRVAVRVFLIHGSVAETPDSALPWAEVAYFGGGYDWGEFDPPPPGTKVFISFRQGDEDQPIVLGCVRGRPTSSQKIRTQYPNEEVPSWETPAKELETPKDIFEDQEATDLRPNRKTWRKSFKGHTILVQEKDGEEFLKIVDRVGQVIEMSCPVTVEVNKTITAQRGSEDVTKGSAKEQEELVDNRGYIRIKDVAGQEILLDARFGNERILIQNQDRSGANVQSIEMSNKRGREYVNIEDKAGNRVRLASNEEMSVLLEDRLGTRLGINSTSGALVIEPRLDFDVTTTRNANVTTGADLVEEIRGDKTSSVINNKSTNVGGDASLGALGSANLNVGGTIAAFCGNAPLSTAGVGNPLGDAVALTLASGNIHLHNMGVGAGKIILSGGPTPLVPLQSLTLDTLLSKWTMQADIAGLNMLSLDGLAQMATLQSAVLTTVGSTALTHLGGTPAVESLVKGTTFIPALTAFVTAVSAACAPIAAGPPDPTGILVKASLTAIQAAATALLGILPTTLSVKVFTQ